VTYNYTKTNIKNVHTHSNLHAHFSIASSFTVISYNKTQKSNFYCNINQTFCQRTIITNDQIRQTHCRFQKKWPNAH